MKRGMITARRRSVVVKITTRLKQRRTAMNVRLALCSSRFYYIFFFFFNIDFVKIVRDISRKLSGRRLNFLDNFNVIYLYDDLYIAPIL